MVKPSRERQFFTHQLWGVFLGILAMNLFIFLLGISVGRKQIAPAAAGMTPPSKTETASPRTPPSADAVRSDIQKELDAHALSDRNPTGSTDSAGKPANPAVDKPAVTPESKAPEKAAATPEPAAKKPSPEDKPAGGWFVQVGAVTDKPAAASFAEKLRKDGYPALLVEPMAKDKKSIFRVRVGPYVTKSQADEAKTKLTEALKKKKNDFFLVKG